MTLVLISATARFDVGSTWGYSFNMSWHKTAMIALALTVFPAWPVHALCIYKGQMNAKTTLSQEFSDARWVVKVKVMAVDEHWSDEDDSWTIYHLRLLTAFKGQPPSKLELFTYRDSGGFYLDKGMNADLGGEYLLFLDPIGPTLTVPATARGATEVNYSCGQSKTWDSVSETDKQQLVKLSKLQGSNRPDRGGSGKPN